MSERTDEVTSPSSEARNLYDSQGQVIRANSPRQGGEGTEQLTEFIRGQPLAAAVIAFALGYFVGKIL